MISDRTPLLWPEAWKAPTTLDLLNGTVINCIATTNKAVAARAAESGLQVIEPHVPPPGVSILEGAIAGIKLDRFGSSAAVSAGPTGEPWVNSNVWPVRLARARKPENTVWIRTQPPANTGGAAFPYSVMIADSALTGAKWMIALDDPLARAIGEGKPAALATWKKITSTAAYFAYRSHLNGYEPEAVIGIVSDFATSSEHEVLNLVTRSGQQYRVIPQERLTPMSLAGLRAVLAPALEPPPAPVQARLLEFATAGGLLINAAPWADVHGSAPSKETHPRFTVVALGQGMIAQPKQPMRDPYVLANDAAILVSHRHDLLRFWNAGAISAYYSSSPDRQRAAVQMVFYSNRPAEDVALRIAGNYRTATISTPDAPAPARLQTEQQDGAIEVHLPAVAQYAAIELEA